MIYEKHYIPKDYIGNVYIFHDILNGVEDSTNRGYTIYTIDSSGILCTQSEMQYGRITDDYVKFYYQNEQGEITKSLYSVLTPNYREIESIADSIAVWSYGYINYNGVDIGMYRVDTLHNFLDSVRDYDLMDIPKDSCM